MQYFLSVSHNGMQYQLPYKIKKSKRRSISIEIKPGGVILVRAPYLAPNFQILSLLHQKESWILKNYWKQEAISVPVKEKTPETDFLEKKYRKAAAKYFQKRVAYYLPLTGGTYQRITIRDQKTRWGSCSSNGTLSFNWRLMLAPPRVLDYVVVHELCHLTYMNHSKDFWAHVASVMPEYQEYRTWLKNNGSTLVIS